jgi:hypothetical protein
MAIAIIETISAFFFIIAIFLSFRWYRLCYQRMKFNVVLLIICFLILFFVSLIDVLQWTNAFTVLLVEELEEMLIPLFSILWCIMCALTIKTYKKYKNIVC